VRKKKNICATSGAEKKKIGGGVEEFRMSLEITGLPIKTGEFRGLDSPKRGIRYSPNFS